jgi:hypothetical protein
MGRITGGTLSTITNGLILYLDSNDPISYTSGSNIWYDISGNENNFIMQGNITWNPTTGFSNFTGNSTGNGNKFYSSNSSLGKALKVANGGNGYTTIVWARSTISGGWRKFFGFSDPDSYIDLYQNTAFPYTYHQEDGSSIYVDGIPVTNDTYILANTGFHMLVSTNSNGGTTTTPTSTLTIGNEPSGNNYPWGGDISIVQLYNRVLSQAEIINNFNSQKSKYGL